MKKTFEPWIGENYQNGGKIGLRILILGEAHYGNPDEKTTDFTQRIVKKLGQEQRFAFFTKVQQLIQNRTEFIPSEDRKTFWDQVAFYNYIQDFPGKTSRIRPTKQMWEEASPIYLETLKELNPELVIILGNKLWDHVPYDDANTPLCGIPHPSSFGFQNAKWRDEIKAKILELKNKKQN